MMQRPQVYNLWDVREKTEVAVFSIIKDIGSKLLLLRVRTEMNFLGHHIRLSVPRQCIQR